MTQRPQPSAAEQDAITGLLLAWRRGADDALEPLIEAVYRQLKALAAACLRGEQVGRTFETTELVHESFVRLVEIHRVDFQDRTHFFAVCARVMRRVLVDHARYRTRAKRGPEAHCLAFDDCRDLPARRVPDLVALDDALRDLARREPDMAKIVELRYFGGLNRDQIAVILGTSSTTVTRRWRMARAWLTNELGAHRIRPAC